MRDFAVLALGNDALISQLKLIIKTTYGNLLISVEFSIYYLSHEMQTPLFTKKKSKRKICNC
ncbi:MAG: hypothetical protein HeimC2_17320 [Candidatus Heimdallarchaeota archaeon LC_2]|nr:MAG: hypothetical protein HeimC2_17320 [Candidatus Heimdallarchaeota archaeon LC_2]